MNIRYYEYTPWYSTVSSFLISLIHCYLLRHICSKHKWKTQIPEGLYCYKIKDISVIDGISIDVIPCPHYTSISFNIKSCRMIGYIGDDLMLFDRCKICGINEK
jgi:hypothetical protein